MYRCIVISKEQTLSILNVNPPWENHTSIHNHTFSGWFSRGGAAVRLRGPGRVVRLTGEARATAQPARSLFVYFSATVARDS